MGVPPTPEIGRVVYDKSRDVLMEYTADGWVVVDDLARFLLIQLAEDELLAQAAAALITGSHWRSHKDVVETAEDVAADYLARSVAVANNWTTPQHIARWDPAGVLADV